MQAAAQNRLLRLRLLVVFVLDVTVTFTSSGSSASETGRRVVGKRQHAGDFAKQLFILADHCDFLLALRIAREDVEPGATQSLQRSEHAKCAHHIRSEFHFPRPTRIGIFRAEDWRRQMEGERKVSFELLVQLFVEFAIV